MPLYKKHLISKGAPGGLSYSYLSTTVNLSRFFKVNITPPSTVNIAIIFPVGNRWNGCDRGVSRC